MKLKRLPVIIGVMTLLGLILFFCALALIPRGETINPQRYIDALQSYARDRTARGQSLPASVSLSELVAGGFLSADGAKAFGAKDVRISLTIDETRPQDVLMEAQLPDGTRLISLGDGSTVVAHQGRTRI